MLKWEDDQAYHRRRAEEEFHRACEARHHRAAAAHFKLFDLHVACFLAKRATREVSEITATPEPMETVI